MAVDVSPFAVSKRVSLSKQRSLEFVDSKGIEIHRVFSCCRKVNLFTPIEAHQADHSFNGIVVLVKCKGPEHIRVHVHRPSDRLWVSVC